MGRSPITRTFQDSLKDWTRNRKGNTELEDLVAAMGNFIVTQSMTIEQLQDRVDDLEQAMRELRLSR